MEDQSMLKGKSETSTQGGINEYANELIKEVCLNGESFSKYQRQIEKRFGVDYYKKCEVFVNEVKHSIGRKRFSNSSIINLKHFAKEIGLSEDTVDIVTNHYREEFEKKSKKGVKAAWILVPLVLLVGIGLYFAFGREKEIPFPDKVESFVNQIYNNSTSFSFVEKESASNEFDSLMNVYGAIYKDLSIEDLDRVDEAIDRYQLITRKTFADSTVIVDEIEFDDSEIPSQEWRNKYKNICRAKIDNIDCDDFTIPNEMMELHPCLVYLVLESKSIDTKSEKQSWFDLYSLMSDEKIEKLYSILYRESYKLGKIEEKYAIRERANQLNTDAYEYAQKGDYYNAMMTINKAIETVPDEANYYDSKGEFYIMQGRLNRALMMWKKVIELNPDFLQDKKDRSTPLYEQLKEKGLLD